MYNLAFRWMRHYKLFFLLGFLILAVQVFLAYKSLGISDLNAAQHESASTAGGTQRQSKPYGAGAAPSNQNSASDDEDVPGNRNRSDNVQEEGKKRAAAPVLPTRPAVNNTLTPGQLGFTPLCNIIAKEAISALQRAKTKDCRKKIADIACAIQEDNFYARYLPSDCPPGNHTATTMLGCYRDEKDFRLLPGYFINLKKSNTPLRCIQLCVQSGFLYAGLQYGTECFCGNESPPTAAKLADSRCNMKCSGDTADICGGYFSMNVYQTGIAKFTAQTANTSVKPYEERVRIAFLLTLSGRALRQVHRLIRALYSPQHVFYIHVDARQDYLYRELLELEARFDNIHLARQRFSTIWGGASLLTMLLQCMKELLASPWQWDFVINLSESDFPVKTVDKLVDFLTANKGRNFVKSHGRETQRFIQKQGLDQTFVECDTHMWRIGDRQLPTGIQVDGGSDWVALSRPFVEYVTGAAQQDELLQGLLVIFQHTLLPAESFFHTVLRNSRFCGTYVDNNLHLTNWKRKLGCKCQQKHVVDWCGCSPNDFKPDDWNRLQGTKNKMIFFARKFEPIINQAVLLQLEQWLFGAYPSGYPNLHSYWQSCYHADDFPAAGDDLSRTVAESVMRIVGRQLQLQSRRLSEITHYLHQDQYKGFLLRYHASPHSNDTLSLELESRVRPIQYVKLAKNSKFAKRLRNFEVSSDFDQKEQVSRNFAKLMGPYTELVLSFTFIGSGTTAHHDGAHLYNLTLLWIDPAGRLQDFNELHIEDAQTDVINFSKAMLKQPLMPGIWTAKLIARSALYAQAKFLVVPLALHSGTPINAKRARTVHAGSGLSLPADFTVPTEWRQHLLAPADVEVLQQLATENAQKVGDSLMDWVDSLVGKFFHLRETCGITEAAVQVSTVALQTLPLCQHTPWSSLAPDPKSDVNTLLKHS